MSSMSTEVAKAAAQAFLAAQQQKDEQPAVQDPELTAPTPLPAAQARQDLQQANTSDVPPLQSQRDLDADYARREFALENELRAQDEADAVGQGPNNIAPPSFEPMQANNPAAITTSGEMADHIANMSAAAHEDIENNASNAKDLAAQKAQTEAAIARDSQGATDDLARDIQARHDHLLGVQAKVELDQQQSMNNYRQVNDEMMNMAMKQPKDIYGAAGVNSVLGKIAVFLGGAGVNGFGANQNLQQIEQMAQFNVQRQKQRYEMLNKVGEGQRTLYGMLNTRLSNAYQVDATLKNMSLEVWKANTLAIANRYADQTTRQAAQTMAQAIDEKKAQTNLSVEQHAETQAAQNLQTYGQMQANQTRAYAAQLKAHGGTNALMPIGGFVGGVPKAEHPRLAKMVGGSRTLISGLNEMEQALKTGEIKSISDLRKFAVNNANLLKGARDFLETGTRIEEGEQSTMQAFQVMPAEGYVNILVSSMGLTNGDLADARVKLEQGKKVVTSATYEAVKTAAPRTATIDSRDPLFAHYDPRRQKLSGVQEFMSRAGNLVREFQGTAHGAKLLQDAPTYQTGN